MKIQQLVAVPFIFFLFGFLTKGDVPKFYNTELVNDSTKIIVEGGFRDENGQSIHFIIEKPEEIKEFISGLKYGEPVGNIFSEESIEIHLVQDYRDITSVNINPKYRRIFANDGHSYQFDLNQLIAWRKKYPLVKYSSKGVNFKTKEEFETFLNVQKQNPNFLYSSFPVFKYEGSFEIEFPKNEIFHNPQAIMDYLNPIIEKVEPDKDKFALSYVLDNKNFSDRNQYTITISGSKQLFEKLRVDDYRNVNWTVTIENAAFHYRKI